MEPLAYTVPQVLDLVGIGRTKLYKLIGSGELTARKLGRRTVILSRDLHDWLESLPRVPPDEVDDEEDGC